MRAALGSTITILSDRFESAPTASAVTVTRADGTVLAAPTATAAGVYLSIPLTAATHLNQLDRLTVAITATVDGLPATQVVEVDVVGSHWVSVGALRGEPDLADAARYPAALLAAVRDEWEEHVEDLCNVRFTPGYEITYCTGNGRDVLHLPIFEPLTVRAVTIDGTAATPADFTLTRDGALTYTTGTFTAGVPVEVHLEAGMTRPPAKLVREVLKAMRRELLARGSKSPWDAISESFDGSATVRYATPNPDLGRFTGILTMDPVIAEHRRHHFGIA